MKRKILEHFEFDEKKRIEVKPRLMLSLSSAFSALILDLVNGRLSPLSVFIKCLLQNKLQDELGYKSFFRKPEDEIGCIRPHESV